MLMPRQTLLLHAAALCACILGATGLRADLTRRQFAKQVEKSRSPAFVLFHAPWCGHCRRMKPAWEKLAGDYAWATTVLIAEVDCVRVQDVCDAEGVQGFPTLRYYHTGGEEATSPAGGRDYSGQRDYASLKKFVEDKLVPASNSWWPW
eukprot:TRINITY_DN71894_c0_g1_i1.p2 TRINITY_DN71894_c0_g1~~TRINITY_DN71894_c0_g1_i1.p2  ORF type:complete len:149 (+),score=24.59 TRINITY_DN71894_c0_g1_i1:85-531(+)